MYGWRNKKNIKVNDFRNLDYFYNGKDLGKIVDDLKLNLM